LPEVAPEEDDDELQAAAVRASSATPATVSCRRGFRPWMRIVISASDHTDNNRKESYITDTHTGQRAWVTVWRR
jgi:hypothetical protein